MSDFFKKIFGNQVIDDLPFPEIPVHTHDGQNSPVLAPSSIDTIQIKAGAVSNIALADDSVTSDKIIDNAVMTEHLNALAVTEQKLATSAVATGKIKNGAVTATKLIQTEAVVTLSAQIAEAVITSAHIGTGVILNATPGKRHHHDRKDSGLGGGMGEDRKPRCRQQQNNGSGSQHGKSSRPFGDHRKNK